MILQALTHSSFGNEQDEPVQDNQRLEYLGDSVLGLIVNESLYHKYPDSSEGQLARMKSILVSEASLAEAAHQIDLGSQLFLGKGEKASGGAGRKSNLADALEAVIAAVYLDLGYPMARDFTLSVLKPQFERIETPESIVDYKSRLQEKLQKRFKKPPVYEMTSESGPDHRKEFICIVKLENRELGRGRGHSRKKAEQDAARHALEKDQGRS